jgi:UDP-N-acetylglucosamine/UDP-N-acetylgalactosamine diphosphorylase
MTNNIVYLANLMALMQWYRHIRARFVGEGFPEALWEGLIQKLDMQITERRGQLNRYVTKIPCGQETCPAIFPEKASPQFLEQCRAVHQRWPETEAFLAVLGNFEGDQRLKDQFEEMIFQGIQRQGRKYVAVVRGLTRSEAETGTRWLQGIVDTIVAETFSRLSVPGGVNVRADETE